MNLVVRNKNILDPEIFLIRLVMASVSLAVLALIALSGKLQPSSHTTIVVLALAGVACCVLLVQKLANRTGVKGSKIHHSFWLILAVIVVLTTACSNKSASPQPKSKAADAVGSITASPNPIQVCDRSGLGITTLSWTATSPTTKRMEVHVGSPDGSLLSHTIGPGSSTTGKWVADGTIFYLQDVTDKLPLNAENTLATVTVRLTGQGCK